MNAASQRLIGGTALALATVLAEPQVAMASETGFADAYAQLIGVMAAPPILVFAIADASYAAQGSWSPGGWAWSEIAMGAIMGAVGAGLTSDATTVRGVSYSGELAALYYAAGGLMLTHGTLSLALYEPSPTVTVSPTDDGLSVSISGRF